MKILIIRFSSMGDIFQCLEVPRSIKLKYPQAEIHWLTKTEFSDIVKTNNFIDKVWNFNRDTGFAGLKHYFNIIKKEKYDLIYDAHNNLRSNLLKLPLQLFTKVKIITRPKNRIRRFLFFKLKRRNLLSMPFRGMESFLEPLKEIGIRGQSFEAHPLDLPVPKSLEKYPDIDQSYCLAPGASFKLKRWPIDYWQKLVLNNPDRKFYIIGGPLDTFCKDIFSIAPDRCVNLAGKLTWVETMWLINQAKLTIANDTGAFHIADFLGKHAIGLMGPSAFGYPSRPKSKAISKNLSCQPCSKDGRHKCSNKIHQQCLQDLTPELVSAKAKELKEEII